MSTSTLSFFFFNDTATTEIYTLSLHDALPISGGGLCPAARHAAHGRSDVDAPAAYPAHVPGQRQVGRRSDAAGVDRKSTRLNSSHSQISYAVFCLKKKKQT